MTERDDFTRLLASAEELARQMVDQEGICLPFAMVVLQEGTLRIIGVEPSTEKSTRVVDLVADLVEALRSERRRKGFRAAALCATGYAARPETKETARAILIGLESEDGRAQGVAIPYSRGLYGAVVYHEALEQPGKAVIFSDRADAQR